MLRNRIKNTKVEENSETESLLNKAKPIVKLKNFKKFIFVDFIFIQFYIQQIKQNWNELKVEFEKADSSGKTFVPNQKAMVFILIILTL